MANIQVITMPLPNPQKLEIGKLTLAAQNTNPFTGQQQTQDWQANYRIGSATMPAMTADEGQAWQFFMDSLHGVINGFQFRPELCSDPRYCYALTSDGTPTGTPKIFRMMRNDYKVTISPLGVRHLSFEFREVL